VVLLKESTVLFHCILGSKEVAEPVVVDPHFYMSFLFYFFLFLRSPLNVSLSLRGILFGYYGHRA
jgi:hypothetical protein